MSELTNPEIRLVEQYVGVLDYLSRCAQAIDTDDWWYLLAKTAELQRRVAWLHEAADELRQAIDRGQQPAGEPSRQRSRSRAATTEPAGCCTPPSPRGGGDRPSTAPARPR
jgi:hypothetical protein